MSFEGLLLVLAFGLVGLAAGHVIRRYVPRRGARWTLFLSLFAPFLIYYGWALAEGCFRSGADPEACYGWGFGLVLLLMFFAPSWFVGMVLGYLNPWSRREENR